jgi:hypothetical protein
MRFFPLKIGRFASSESKVTAEIPPVSVDAQAVVYYSTMQKSALARERCAIDGKSNSIYD